MAIRPTKSNIFKGTKIIILLLTIQKWNKYFLNISKCYRILKINFNSQKNNQKIYKNRENVLFDIINSFIY